MTCATEGKSLDTSFTFLSSRLIWLIDHDHLGIVTYMWPHQVTWVSSQHGNYWVFEHFGGLELLKWVSCKQGKSWSKGDIALTTFWKQNKRCNHILKSPYWQCSMPRAFSPASDFSFMCTGPFPYMLQEFYQVLFASASILFSAFLFHPLIFFFFFLA